MAGSAPSGAAVRWRPWRGRVKDMDRWLGDGGMEVIGLVGAGFEDYGVDGEDLGWVTASGCPPPSPATPTAPPRPASTP